MPHHIPGYTGHLPQNRERFGISYREASAATIANQRAKGVSHPIIPLDEPAPNAVRAAGVWAAPPARATAVGTAARGSRAPACAHRAPAPSRFRSSCAVGAAAWNSTVTNCSLI